MTNGPTAALPKLNPPVSEAGVELSPIKGYLESLGFVVRARKSGNVALDAAWPSKTKGASGAGEPDLLLSDLDQEWPLVVWENKGSNQGVSVALSEARFYIEGVHQKLGKRPNLPRVAVGYDGTSLRSEFYGFDGRWVTLKENGATVLDRFVEAEALSRGIRSDGNIVEAASKLDARVLRSVFDQMKVLYRGIPALKSGRRPIDFTVALLTLRLLVERERWGTWSEQPTLVPDAVTADHAIAERFNTLVKRCMARPKLRSSYGSIFQFYEHDDYESEIAFDFESVLTSIPQGKQYFEKMFTLLDTLPQLHGADIDIFGEVYQAIGDDAVKKAFGEYFTGRHIIAGMIPILFARAGANSFSSHFDGKSIADIACGTGGFLTETLRYARREFSLDEEATTTFAKDSFFGYDLSASNASRARVNMYFAGDGFSVIRGGVDSLDAAAVGGPGARKFDYLLTNPPYGSSSEHHLIHEAFLRRIIDLLKPSTGWGLVVLPVGTLENPRSSLARLDLLRRTQITDVISLPKHAFAPYTTQRTAIVILRRRPKDLAATTWQELLDIAGPEKVSMYIVDNDGFANSDKRFPTRRKDANGEWEHDDLAKWIDMGGITHPGRLYDALINEKANEENQQYGRFSLEALNDHITTLGADRGSGIELLPDNFLRSAIVTTTVENFTAAADQLAARLSSDADNAGGLLRDLQLLLAAPIELDKQDRDEARLEDIMSIRKGNTGLTEAVMYAGHDASGVPVYGGGVGNPANFIARGCKTAGGKLVTVFDAPAIVLSMDGSSGSMRVIESGSFACNHHAVVLQPRQDAPSLEIVIQQAEARLKALASNKSGSATLTMGTVKSLLITWPKDTEKADRIRAARKKLDGVRRRIL